MTSDTPTGSACSAFLPRAVGSRRHGRHSEMTRKDCKTFAFVDRSQQGKTRKTLLIESRTGIVELTYRGDLINYTGRRHSMNKDGGFKLQLKRLHANVQKEKRSSTKEKASHHPHLFSLILTNIPHNRRSHSGPYGDVHQP